MLCLKQNTEGPVKSNGAGIGINSITSLVRLAALESAFRPNLSLGTQVAFFVTLRVLNYINSVTSLVRFSARRLKTISAAKDASTNSSFVLKHTSYCGQLPVPQSL